ncbi:MAG: sulfotransferase [Proteobacteria bacterium]|nr:sulfotransferase [Pseudomonadota bacterium]
MPRDLKADQAMLREVLSLAQKRDFGRAGAIANQALADGFEHPLLLNVAATCLEQEGKLADALRLLERAVELAPEDIGARNALGLCLQRLERPAEALRHTDVLLKQNPGLGFAHANRGNALIALGHLGRARSSHLRALELEPGNVSSLASLASIASHRGNHDEARTWARQVLAVVPNFPDAVIALAAAELAGGTLAEAEALLRQLLADQRVSPIDKARANGLLGDVLDADRRYTEALAAYSACNEALRRIHNRFASGTSLTTYTNQLLTTVGSDVDRYARRGGESQAPVTAARGHVFLIGFPRSGTTLLEVVLDGHPQVASLDEHELLTESVQRYMADPRDLSDLEKANETQLRPLREAYWNRVRENEIDVSGKVFVDKYPMSTLKLPLIARLFPDARILFAARDPREVVLACFRRRFKMNPATYEFLTTAGAAALYDAVMPFAELMRPVFGARWRDVRYESLVADFTGQMRAICEFLGLEWLEGMDDFAVRARERERSTPSTAQLARGLDRSRTVHWKHYSSALEPVMPVLNKWVERLGYSR